MCELARSLDDWLVAAAVIATFLRFCGFSVVSLLCLLTVSVYAIDVRAQSETSLEQGALDAATAAAASLAAAAVWTSSRRPPSSLWNDN